MNLLRKEQEEKGRGIEYQAEGQYSVYPFQIGYTKRLF